MDSSIRSLRCFNPFTGERDGDYCKWEGKGKCIKCSAVDRIEELEAERDALHKLIQEHNKECECPCTTSSSETAYFDHHGYDSECPAYYVIDMPQEKGDERSPHRKTAPRAAS